MVQFVPPVERHSPPYHAYRNRNGAGGKRRLFRTRPQMRPQLLHHFTSCRGAAGYALPSWPGSLLPVHAFRWSLACGQRLFPHSGQTTKRMSEIVTGRQVRHQHLVDVSAFSRKLLVDEFEISRHCGELPASYATRNQWKNTSVITHPHSTSIVPVC